MAEVEPEGLFGAEGTYWSGTGTFQEIPIMLDLAFFAGIMYACNTMSCMDLSTTASSYADFFFLTIVEVILFEDAVSFNGILIPFLGLGWGSALNGEDLAVINFTKTSDNWTPPSE